MEVRSAVALAGTEPEKAKLVGILEAGLFPAELLLKFYLTGVSAYVHNDGY